jgi:hypothetical protein
MLSVMSDEKPNPLDDVRKGLGLLFRAAKTAAEKLPTKDLEEVVVTSAREVGRALENVGRTLEREVFGKKDEPPAQEKPPAEEPPDSDEGHPPASSSPPDEPKPPDAA